jgi:hypothetical protein
MVSFSGIIAADSFANAVLLRDIRGFVTEHFFKPSESSGGRRKSARKQPAN